MPDLPTLTVTQEQADRLLAAFGDVPAYKKWLRERLIEHVRRYEMSAVNAEVEAFRAEKIAEIDAALPGVGE